MESSEEYKILPKYKEHFPHNSLHIQWKYNVLHLYPSPLYAMIKMRNSILSIYLSDLHPSRFWDEDAACLLIKVYHSAGEHYQRWLL